MQAKILLSTAYLPPIQYLSLIKNSRSFLIEANENYIKQTYRNRFYILSPQGPLMLPVPVFEGSRRKVRINDVRIDYSKRWQQVHLRAIRAAYGNSPWFDFYFEELEQSILEKHEFLFDLNQLLLRMLLRMLKIEREINTTTEFVPESQSQNDYRYILTPEKREEFRNRKYIQVFGEANFIPNLSIMDLIFNMGPEAGEYL